MINSISSASSAAVAATSQVQAKPGDSDGDHDGSAPKAANIGPAVIVSLSGSSPAAKNDMAQGDPDGDGH